MEVTSLKMDEMAETMGATRCVLTAEIVVVVVATVVVIVVVGSLAASRSTAIARTPLMAKPRTSDVESMAR